jgi:D-alanyl-D-alanine carboxypeptidase/D-alanyl-D-alanine-endopeptidase (penicillin-binding protein 4)
MRRYGAAADISDLDGVLEVKARSGTSEGQLMRPNSQSLRPSVTGRRSKTLTALAVAGSLTAAVGATAPAAQADTRSVRPQGAASQLSATDTRMSTTLSRRLTAAGLGSKFSGTVVDLGTGATVWSRRGDTALMPASTTKLVTATNALSVYGPTHRFTTTVRRGSTWHDVVLVGSGDPSLSGADLSVLAKATAAQVRAHGSRTVRVWADDYLFVRPSLARGWTSAPCGRSSSTRATPSTPRCTRPRPSRASCAPRA